VVLEKGLRAYDPRESHGLSGQPKILYAWTVDYQYRCHDYGVYVSGVASIGGSLFTWLSGVITLNGMGVLSGGHSHADTHFPVSFAIEGSPSVGAANQFHSLPAAKCDGRLRFGSVNTTLVEHRNASKADV
jgi:hypothetical protein